MKKMMAFLVAILTILCAFFGFGNMHVARATEIDFSAVAAAEYMSIIKEGDLLRFYDRTAGAEGERLFALYLQQRFLALGYEPNGTDLANESFEPFIFTSAIDGLEKQSQNVKFIKRGITGEKRLIICTSYDNAFGFAEGQDSYSIIGEDASLSGVVAAITLARVIKDISFDYDVEFVFFGAEYHDFAGGSNFALGINKKESENILLAINIDDLSDGSLFYYDSELGTKYGKAFESFCDSEFEIEIAKYTAGNSVIFSDGGNLPYTHRALMSDNSLLMKSGVRTISLLSCSKTGVLGNEYYRDYVLAAFEGTGVPISISENAANVASVVSAFVQENNIQELAVGNGSVSKYLTDARYASLLMIVVIVAIWASYFVVYKKYLKKLRRKYTSKSASDEMVGMLDNEIDKSKDPEVKLMREQIKEAVTQKIKEKFDSEEKE